MDGDESSCRRATHAAQSGQGGRGDGGFSRRRARVLSVGLCVVLSWAPWPWVAPLWSQEEGVGEGDGAAAVAAAVVDMTASDLLRAGTEAFDRQNFAEAGAHWERLETDFGESEAVSVELARVRPLLAIARVATGEFAVALRLIDASLAAPLAPPQAILEQLRFWRGVCLLKAGELTAAQQAFGEFHAEGAHDHERRMEAMVLFGMAYLMQGEFADAEVFFAGRLERLQPDRDVETRGRLAVLRLHALMEGGEHRRALEHLEEWFPRMREITQLAAFQSLALQLGAHFLDSGDHYAAIGALQRIWPRERLLKHQRARLLDLEARHTGMKLRKANQDAIYRIEGMLTRLRREIENFEAIAHFDSALRLRLALAYQGLGRHREAGLVLEAMLRQLPDDPVVEQASLRLVQNWMQARRWDKAVDAADTYVARFGAAATGNLSTVLFLRADALHSAADHEGAIAAFDALIARFPGSEMVPKSVFMKGICHLNAGRNEVAAGVLASLSADHPESPLCEDADYWIGMAWSFAKEHQRAREHLQRHLERYPAGRYRGDSVFRRAFSLFATAAYSGAVAELRAFVTAFPDSAYSDEARLLLGDALGALGEIDAAIASYQLIRLEARRYFEDGQFKSGKALRLTGQHRKLREHFAGFIASHPQSPRIVEAVYWIGWSHQAEGDGAEARRIYWETIGLHGDDPALPAVEDILTALPEVYPGGERAGLSAALRELAARAQREGRKTLLARATWAQAQLLAASDPARAEALLLRVAGWLDPGKHSPRMLADAAEARLRAGQWQLAEELFTGLRKWNPRAVEKERAYLGLGQVALARDDAETALDWFARAARVAVNADAIARALLAKASVETDLGRSAEARSTLEELLGSRFVDGRSKARGLLAYGAALEAEGDSLKATAYYQRVHVAYGRHRDLVARAYLSQGRALERLSEQDKALQVYQELASREDLADCAEVEMGRARITALLQEKEVLQ